MSDPRTDFFSSGDNSPAAGEDARTAFFNSAEPPTSEPASPESSSPKAPEGGVAPWKEVMGHMAAQAASGLGASAAAGVRSVYDFIRGKSLSEVDKHNQAFIADHTYQPTDTVSRVAAKGMQSPYNPMNYPGEALDYAGEKLNQATDSTALGPVLSGVAQVGLGALPFVGKVKTPSLPTRTNPGWGAEASGPPRVSVAAGTAPAETTALSASGPARAPGFEPADVPERPLESPQIPERPDTAVDTEPVEGGLPGSATASRAEILKRVGLEHARASAINGDAKSAATDWQLSKFDEPAGVEAKSQFEHERNALLARGQKLVADTGGTLGTDEDTLHARGQTISKPFDALSDWFDAQRQKLYQQADEKAKGAPVSNLEGVDALLKDPKFRNTLLAKDQGNLLNSIENQLGEFRKQSPGGFSVHGTEQFRQWLNQIWTNDNKGAIGQVKDAVDEDVLKGAGEDIYGPARALVHMRKQTLDNPNGISRLMEHDPQTPINRVTSLEKIPDTLTRLPVAQFDNVLKTLDTMPEEIQPLAQAAKAEIKAHMMNKVNDAGSSTSGQWNAREVDKVVRANAAKLQSAFADQPQALRDLQDLRGAGQILSVNQSYPGAAAQAANAVKRGLMSKALTHVGGAVGGGAGSVLGPLGAAGGAAAGEALGAKVGASAAERSAVKNWRKGVKDLTE